MGIKKLYKFLSNLDLIKEYPNLTKYVNFNKNYNNKSKSNSIIIAVDFWLYAHKFKYSYGNIIIGFWNQIIRLLSHKIIPLYVYDGKAPLEKQYVLQTRINKKKKIKIKLDKLYDDINTDEIINDNNINNNNNLINELNEKKNKLEKYIIDIKKIDIKNIKQFFNVWEDVNNNYNDMVKRLNFMDKKKINLMEKNNIKDKMILLISDFKDTIDTMENICSEIDDMYEEKGLIESKIKNKDIIIKNNVKNICIYK